MSRVASFPFIQNHVVEFPGTVQLAAPVPSGHSPFTPEIRQPEQTYKVDLIGPVTCQNDAHGNPQIIGAGGQGVVGIGTFGGRLVALKAFSDMYVW